MAARPTFPLVIIGRKYGFAITCQGTYTGDAIPQVPNIQNLRNIQRRPASHVAYIRYTL